MRPTGFLIVLSGSSRGNGNRDFFITLSFCLRHWHFFADSLSRMASVISGGQRSVPLPLVMWFHSLTCASILGGFLCLVCLAFSSEECCVHLQLVEPLLFDAEMSVSLRKSRASGHYPGTSNKKKLSYRLSQ